MPYKYIFKAEIFPHRVQFNFTLPTNIEMWIFDHDFWIHGKITSFTAINSLLELHFLSENQYVPGIHNTNIETLKNCIELSIRSIVDAFCFIHSYNYELSMTSVDCPELAISNYTFGVQWEYSHIWDNTILWDIMRCYLNLWEKSKHLVNAFTDFRLSIKYPDATGQYCFRSLERIRRWFFDDISIENDNRDKDGWEKMAKNLQVTEEEYSIFEKMRKDFAQPNRHWNYPLITYKEREGFMRLTRSILNKFIHKMNLTHNW